MTVKEFVKSKMPNAKVEKQKTNGGKAYFLIRDGKSTGYMSSGDTESQAWKQAKERIIESENLKK
jgi:hypothetical protein